jgi:hypothetical protein
MLVCFKLYLGRIRQRLQEKSVVSRFVFGARVCDPQRLGLHGGVLAAHRAALLNLGHHRKVGNFPISSARVACRAIASGRRRVPTRSMTDCRSPCGFEGNWHPARWERGFCADFPARALGRLKRAEAALRERGLSQSAARRQPNQRGKSGASRAPQIRKPPRVDRSQFGLAPTGDSELFGVPPSGGFSLWFGVPPSGGHNLQSSISTAIRRRGQGRPRASSKSVSAP